MVAAAVGHETWKLAVAQLGGTELVRAERAHRRDPGQVLGELGEALASVRRRYGRRIRGSPLLFPGPWSTTTSPKRRTSVGTTSTSACSGRASETAGPRPATTPALPPSPKRVAELRWAPGRSCTCTWTPASAVLSSKAAGLSLARPAPPASSGICPSVTQPNSAVVVHEGAGTPPSTAPPSLVALKQPQPADEVSYVRHVLAVARAAPVAPHEEVAAAQQMASSAGRGVAGLVNAFDPDIVTFGGLGRELLEVAGDHVYAAYLAGLMHFRLSAPPPLVPAHFGDDAPLVGATEEAFSAFLTEGGMRSWSPRRQRSADL